MSVHFEKASVKDIRRETADCVSVSFTIPASLQPAFAYREGQYLTLRASINGEEVRRSYSLCSSPLEQEWRIAVKEVPGGLFSTYINQSLQPGDAIELMPPMGKFHTTLDAGHRKKYVGIAAGSGITPIISIIKTILQTEPASSFTLVYGNRTRHSIIFKEELEALKNKYMHRFSIIHVLSREITDATLNTGRIDAAKCDQLFNLNRMVDSNSDEFFICGPEDMIFCVKSFLLGKNIDGKKIHIELFTTESGKRAAAPQHSAADNEPASMVTVKLDGNSLDFKLDYNGENILDAAMHHGLDVPYSCKAGVCCTCRAKLVSGTVEMDVNYGLEPEEIAAGFILTCQSHPTSENVVVDFDAR
ncbi:1,2-phenylacetyl-CoA epoxidase subunit PaaE [Deminuibacter soli]|uniref:Phenylacetate-CoA oxygenase/reductase subunit PaaK n=1 Tax=Deminuibacter soli TaxID=2291815 RepID=A0A3E1NPS7_9BACT|nr:1,2-phenylacetyl-CoA epoxidase subunit PaaE [Deminuibacter soli]RFM29936.1 phenylacetate-CoA oxygenase/reductase subunit PaaK [Deminuibacter soli]